jgi:iron(III) transport system ATP-binding protein
LSHLDGPEPKAAELEISGLSAGYGGVPVLLNTDLVVRSGSLTCVLGASGCGKTTLLRVIAGFTPAQDGAVRIGGQLVESREHRLSPEQREVGYVPQEGALFPHLTVEQNVGFALPRMRRQDRRARADAVGEMLDLVGMEDVAGRLPHQLSGGQQQRVAVARALASRPKVLLLDEPFASLDAGLRARIREDIRSVLQAAHVTAVLVTHDRAEALSLGDEVAVLRDGHVLQVDAPVRLYRRPSDPYVASFVGDANLLPATVQGRRVATALGDLDLDVESDCRPGDGPGVAVVRPEHLRLTAPDGRGGVQGEVIRVEYHGHDARVELNLVGADPEHRVVARVAGILPPSEHDRVTIEVTAPVWVLPSGPQAIPND